MRSNSEVRTYRKSQGTIFFWLYAAGTLAICLTFLSLRLTTASDGGRQEPGEQGITPAGLKIKILTAQPVGLQDRDIVIAVEGLSLDDWLKNLFDADVNQPVWRAGVREGVQDQRRKCSGFFQRRVAPFRSHFLSSGSGVILARAPH